MTDTEDTQSEAFAATEEVKRSWQEGGASSVGASMGSAPVAEAMLHTWCKTCGGDVEKNNWKEDKDYCSKACRKERHNPTIMVDETKKEFAPMYMRAWHYPLQLMCEVLAIDYPANRLYVTISARNDYKFNGPLQEFTVMTNVGNFQDKNGKRIVEGDVIAVEVEGQERWQGTVAYDRKLGALMIKEPAKAQAEGEEPVAPRIIPVIEEITKSLEVVGDMYTYREPSDKTAIEVAGQNEENVVS